MSTRRLANAGFVMAGVLTLVLGFTLPAQSQTNPPPAKTVLVDFGNNTSYRGTNTPSPDIQGHYWNSVHYQYVAILTNAAGGTTSLAYGLDFLTGTDSYNGPSGVCTGDVPCPPSACIIDTNALGYLGINEAVYDYFVTSAFQIQGADPTKTYSLTFFGSHKNSDSDYTIYSLCNSSYAVITSVNLFVQSPSDHSAHNSNTVATISGVSPQSNGTFYIKFYGTNSTQYGFLNCMQIVDLSTNAPPPPPPVDKTVFVDFGNNTSFRGTNTPSPDIQGHWWNSVDSSVFWSPLTNAAGTATLFALGFDSVAATDSYNGPAGDTTVNGPSACVINTNALGYLGINEAVYDYYVSSTFQIQGMDPAKSYSLTFFGSHKYNVDNVTVYSVCSDATYSTIITSATLNVGSGANHNQDRLATIGPISPQTNGIMYVKFMGQTSVSNGYLNCLQIVDLSSTNAPTDPFASWLDHYFPGGGPNSLPGADPDGDGMINTNEFLAGFNPTNGDAYPHIISVAKASTNLVITYLGANGDNTWTPGIASRTNVLEYTTGTPNGSYSNNFASTGQTNVLSGGAGVGVVTSFIETNVVTGPTRYYRVRVLVP